MKRALTIFLAVVLALVLSLGAAVLSAGVARAALIWSEHAIEGNFDAARSVYATDVDGDGDVDVLGVALYADDITWWENDGSENFTKHTIDPNFDGATSVYATDVDGDGDIDVLGAAQYADDITWWENDGSENFTKNTIDPSFDGAVSVYATDVDGDGDIDILGAGFGADDITWWENLWETTVEATIDINPDTLNLKSKGKWVTCYIELPEGYDLEDVDVSTVELSYGEDSVPEEWGDVQDGVLMVKFNRSDVQEMLDPGDEIEVTLSGQLTDGTPFEGTDTIRVVE